MSTSAPAFGAGWSAGLRRADEADLTAWLSLGLEMCDEADRLALRWYRREIPTVRKPDRTFVTEADQAIERLIRERVRNLYPDHGFVGEEYGDEMIPTWISPATSTASREPKIGTPRMKLCVPSIGSMYQRVLAAPSSSPYSSPTKP